MLTLRCRKQDTDPSFIGSGAGYIVLAEPTGDTTSINNFIGQSMAVRPACFYENIFKEMNLDIVFREDYPSYRADKTRIVNQERVWLLRESPCSAFLDPTQSRL